MTESNAILMKMVNPVKSKIDALRQDAREKIPDELAKLFTRKLKKHEWKQLFHGIGRADVPALGRKAAMEIMSDPSRLDSSISALEEELRNISPEHADLYKAKAEALARYMVTPKPFGVSPHDPACA